MASLELIEYLPHRHCVADDGKVTWERDTACRSIKSLPQLFWADGTPWVEANLWAHERATSGKIKLKTVQSNMRHLHKFAKWLEVANKAEGGEAEGGLDWRHFPMLERDRVLIRWRKKLIEERDKLGLLAPSTATQRMNATIHFYRYARANGFIGRDVPLWQDRQVIHRYYDAVGFERTMLLSSTDLAIPYRRRHGGGLEDGLMPITKEQMHELLDFTQQEGNASPELHLMLLLGFFTGARIGTITDLKKGSLDNAVADPAVPGLVYIAVGPGHNPHVATKFDVQGRILVPDWLFHDLCAYVTDPRRLAREAKAPQENKDLIFLTRFGRRYAESDSASGTAVGRAMVDLRRAATLAGLQFMKTFHFHMSRATFGTWLTATLLEKGHDVKAVLAFVSDALLHKDIKQTLDYVKFVQKTKIKIKVANEFTEAFLGLSTRIGGGHA